MPDHWRRFREKLRQVPPVDDIDGSEILPIVHGDGTRSIRLDQIVELGLDPSKVNLPPAAPPIPPGTICPTFGPVAPGWLKCDGSLVGRAEYPKLFAAIGETHGKGDGATTFALPEIRTKLVTGKAPDATWMIAT
jgi:hypothetical protein